MAPKRHAAATTPSTTNNNTTTTPKPTLSSGPATLKPNASPLEIAHYVLNQYLMTTPQRTKLLDAFMGFLAIVAVAQFLYCVLAGNYPFNAFLSGFCAAVGQFVLTASLRMQTSDGSGSVADWYRAFADYVFGSVILHFFCVNFIN
ncbi:putative oligosaccharyl transferase subunit Dad1 [Aspergillus glaucus CBS 516.65]|uniref:Dolichyl-diphosphooligosaccharide--protein glycosyltransferase subunit OST2 n=1 Tax=Aspergillus glaucus CBS 516.65 TaxID=1160497 RepID=A0A1L9VR88_ASPGL|nr:hypothetical protein ASPGLDRAFT_121040 [Aspergillus glaucus CBS 516.65]OJJ86445.1 hypothetical protein ASPGLDRAFT_121040 [Aspergillus glaucus CBS 516.65]